MRQKSIIEGSAFSSVLSFQRCNIPLSFVKWIANHTDVSCSDICVIGDTIPITPHTVHVVLGIPTGGVEINNVHNEAKEFFENHYRKTKPLISFFGSKLLDDKDKNNLCTEDVPRCFMTVALSTFLCPNSDTYQSPKYLGPLVDVNSISNWDWSKFVYDWLITYIGNFKKENNSKSQHSK
uniref:Aminotransferase-like plant mobile domain-containing protein n=1 Tax=Oryza brachyantha TaxID=4533 RepID=J3NCX9_ORYBR